MPRRAKGTRSVRQGARTAWKTDRDSNLGLDQRATRWILVQPAHLRSRCQRMPRWRDLTRGKAAARAGRDQNLWHDAERGIRGASITTPAGHKTHSFGTIDDLEGTAYKFSLSGSKSLLSIHDPFAVGYD